MEVTYQNTFEDLERMAEYVVENTPQGRRFASLIFWRTMVPVAVLCLVVALFGKWTYALPAFAICAVVIWASRKKAVIKGVEKQYRKPAFDYFWQSVTVTVTEEGIRTKRQSGEAFYKWPMVERVADAEGYVFIILRGVGNFAVPAQAFGSRVAKDAFYAAVQAGLSRSGPRP